MANGESNDKERLLKPLEVKAKYFPRQITKCNYKISVFNEIFWHQVTREIWEIEFQELI